MLLTRLNVLKKLFSPQHLLNTKFSNTSTKKVQESFSGKSFDEVPGPLILPFIGSIYQYLPVVGHYNTEKLHEANYDKYKKFGPIVRENLTSFDPPLLNIFEPDDFEMVFRSESQLPHRQSHLALQKYRLRKKHLYASGGLLPTNGQEWLRLRKAFQRGLSSRQSAQAFLPSVDDVIMEWITSLELEENGRNKSDDLLTDLWKLFVELVGITMCNYRFNALHEKNGDLSSMAMKVVAAALETNHYTVNTDFGLKLWRKLDTPAFSKITTAQNYMESVAIHLLKVQEQQHAKNPQHCLVSVWKNQPEISSKDILAMVVDFLLAGIDTSSNTTSFLLYYVSNHPEIQQKLYEESCHLLSNKTDTVSVEILEDAKYAKSVLKETLRLRPISIGIGRLLTKDTIIGGFSVPKGTNTVTNNLVACRLERHFKKPLSFIPERWLRDDPLYKQPHPFLLMPFGYGIRACIARRLAEQNILVLLLKVVRNFVLKWDTSELDSENHLIQRPDRPIKLKFIKR